MDYEKDYRQLQEEERMNNNNNYNEKQREIIRFQLLFGREYYLQPKDFTDLQHLTMFQPGYVKSQRDQIIHFELSSNLR